FMYYQGNSRLKRQLDRISDEAGSIETYPLRYCSGRLQNIRTLLSPGKARKIAARLKAADPDIVVVVQGSIQGSSLGLVASKKCGYKTISYIPMTHNSSVTTKGAITPAIKDAVNKYYYSLPDKFIVPTQFVKNDLILKGVSSEIALAYNVLDFSGLIKRDRGESRRKYGMRDKEYVAALIGRVCFRQKGHNFLLEAISKHRSLLAGVRFFLVGDGPDDALLRSIIKKGKLDGMVNILPWENDLSHIYSAIDMLIIPSRFEGVPLVMKEAIFFELPIVASNVDGMSETLPGEWLFEFGDSDGLIKTMLDVKKQDCSGLIKNNKEILMQECSSYKFEVMFKEALGTDK
ncbi:MAG: glycosyltransferase family 4 protein, partial [Nitrospirota bacterium]